MTPIISKVDRKAPYAEVKAGNMAGVDMRGQGKVDGEVKISMIHPQQVEPQLEGVNTGDYINIKGVPDINMAITPEVPRRHRHHRHVRQHDPPTSSMPNRASTP